jgi:hypothetical protein
VDPSVEYAGNERWTADSWLQSGETEIVTMNHREDAMKRIDSGTTSSTALVATTIALLLIGCARSTPNLSPDAIRRIRVGMPVAEVEGILGKPLGIRSMGTGRTIHDYATASFSGPSLWISYGNGLVVLVHAKLHKVIGEDHAIYEEAAHHARFETPEFEPAFKSH